jgi:hypothetical protein
MIAEKAAACISSYYTLLLVDSNEHNAFTLNLPKTVFEDLFKLLADPNDENVKVEMVVGILEYLCGIRYLPNQFSAFMDSKMAMKICLQAAQIYGLMGKISFKDPLDSKAFFSIYKKHYPNETDFMLGAVSTHMCDFFANKMIAFIRSKNLDNTLFLNDFECEYWNKCLSIFISDLLLYEAIHVNEQSFVEKMPHQLMHLDGQGINTLNLLDHHAPSEMDAVFDMLNTILCSLEDPSARGYFSKAYVPMPMSLLCAVSFKVGLVIGRQANETNFSPKFYAHLYNRSFDKAQAIHMKTFSDWEVCVYRLLNLISPKPTAAPVTYAREARKQNLVEIKAGPRNACCNFL